MIDAMVQVGRHGHVEQEVLEHLLAPIGVGDLGMELHPVDRPFGALQGRHRDLRRPRRDPEAVGRPLDRVEVAHPHVLGHREVGEQHRRHAGGDLEGRPAILSLAGVGDLPAELLGHELGAVADAQDGDAQVEDARIEPGRTLDVDGCRPARQDDP